MRLLLAQLVACHSWPKLLMVTWHRKILGRFLDNRCSSSPRAAGGLPQLLVVALQRKKIGSILRQQVFLLSLGSWWLATAGRNCWWSPDRRKRLGKFLDNSSSSSPHAAGGLPQLAAAAGGRLTQKKIGSILRQQMFLLSSRSWGLATADRSCWWSPDTEKDWVNSYTTDVLRLLAHPGACHSWPQLLMVAWHRKRLGQFLDISCSSSPRAAGGMPQLAAAADGHLTAEKDWVNS